MEPRNRPRSRSDAIENQRAILRATRDLCGSHGESFSVKEIAAASGVSVATIYRHFAGKQALMDGVSLSRWGHLVHLVTKPKNGATHIIEVLDAYSRMCSADSAFLHALNLRPGFGELAERMRLRFDPAFELQWQLAQNHQLIRKDVHSVDVINMTSAIQDPTRRLNMLALLLSAVVTPQVQLEAAIDRLGRKAKREAEGNLFSLA